MTDYTLISILTILTLGTMYFLRKAMLSTTKILYLLTEEEENNDIEILEYSPESGCWVKKEIIDDYLLDITQIERLSISKEEIEQKWT